MDDTKKQEEKPALEQIPIGGRFDKHRSSYWAGSLAVLPLRYASRPFFRPSWSNPETSYLSKHKYSGLAGTLMYAVTALYARTTWKDMHAIFAQSLGWEFNKDPKDVTFNDFWKSENTIVQQTTKNYVMYNVRRFGVNAAFFLPFLAKSTFKKYNLDPEAGVDLGLGANGAYLFSDVLSRQITPFEELQTLIDRKVNHSDNIGDQITASDLMNVYERHASKGMINSFLGQRGTPAWDKSIALFSRMADLMNQTYKNTEKKEETSFGFPEFIYMIGHGMINPQSMEHARAFVEIANHRGIKELKEAAKELRQGDALDKVLEKHPVKIPVMDSKKSKEAAVTTISTIVKPSGFNKNQLLSSEKPLTTLAGQVEIQRGKQELNGETVMVN